LEDWTDGAGIRNVPQAGRQGNALLPRMRPWDSDGSHFEGH
jgi:hypothetical protein